MKKSILIISMIFLVSGCTNQEEKVLLNDKIVELENQLEAINTKNYDVVNKNLQLIKDIEIKEEIINHLEKTNEALADALLPKSIEDFREFKWTKLNEYLESTEEIYMHVLPYEESDTTGRVGKGYNLRILAYVRNKTGEEWALVRHQFAAQIGAPSLGYVKLDNLTELSDRYKRFDETEVPDLEIEGVKIGATLEEVIGKFGNDYIFVSENYFFGIVFDNLVFELIQDGEQQKVAEIGLNSSMYLGEDLKPNTFKFEDVEIGDKALSIINHYSNIYDEYTEHIEAMGEEVNFLEFELDENYVIHIDLSDANFDENTVIDGIGIWGKGWVYRD